MRTKTPDTSRKIAALNLPKCTIEVGVNCVEHFVDELLVKVGPESQDGAHELLFGYLALVVTVRHAEEIGQQQTHFFCPLAQLVYFLANRVKRVDLLGIGRFAGCFLFVLFRVFVAQGFVELLLLF